MSVKQISPTISIVIPNYNGEHLLKKNLPKVIDEVKHYSSHIEIIIPDDGSEDNSLPFLNEFVQNIANRLISIIPLPSHKATNMGFSSNVNRAVEKATGEIILLLNSDVFPEHGFLEPLLKHFSDESVFAVGCMDKSIEEGNVVLRGRGIGKWQRGFLIHRKGSLDKINTLWVSGGSGVFRKSLWNKLGGLDTNYDPFYWEDIDLSYRALKSGYQLIFEPQSIVVHEHDKGAIKSSSSKSRIKAMAYRNQFFFVWKNATDLSLQFEHLLWLPYHLCKAVLRGDLAFFVGFFHALLGLPRITKESFRVQKFFKKSDKEIMVQFQS